MMASALKLIGLQPAAIEVCAGSSDCRTTTGGERSNGGGDASGDCAGRFDEPGHGFGVDIAPAADSYGIELDAANALLSPSPQRGNVWSLAREKACGLTDGD